MKEFWVKNMFWILSVISAIFVVLAFLKDREAFLIIFSTITFFSFVIACYYSTILNLEKQKLDAYEKATHHQNRKQALRVISGGKNGSTSNRTGRK